MKTYSRISLLVALLVVLGSASNSAYGEDAVKARLGKVVKASLQASQEASKENSDKDAAAKEGAEEIPLQFIVTFKRGATEEAIQSFEAGAKKVSEKLGIKVMKNMKLGKVSLDHSTKVDAAVKTLEALESLEGVYEVVADEIQKLVRPEDEEEKPETKPVKSDDDDEDGLNIPRKVPDDDWYNLMWAPEMMNADKAWDTITGAEPGSHRPVVVVIGSGVDYSHEDLADSMYVNEAELYGTAGIDDDGNGYIDDTHGWNARTDSPVQHDVLGDGTHAAGIIGALGNNHLGVVGLHWRPRLVSCKFIGNAGWGWLSDAMQCFDYAVAVGAEIINNSWSGGSYKLWMHDALVLLGQQGIISVCASGDNHKNTDNNPSYPSSYDVDSIVSVGSVNFFKIKPFFSNWGKQTVDIAAPGCLIYSTLPGDNYGMRFGTSAAAAQISGALALLKAVEPSMSVETMRTILKRSTKKFHKSHKFTKWNGYLDLNKAVKKAMNYVSMIILAPPTMTCESGCAMSGMTCDEAKTAQANTGLAECYSMLENSVIDGTFVQGESRSFDVAFPPPGSAMAPVGCFVEHMASTYVVNLNTYTYGIAEVGCKAPPSLLSTSNRACVCSPQI